MLESDKSSAISELKDNPLSEREMDVSRLLATGASNAEIARELNISPHTVKVHTRNIFEKLDVNSRTEASMLLIQRGWISVPGLEPADPESETERALDSVELDSIEDASPDTSINATPASEEASTHLRSASDDSSLPALDPQPTLTEPPPAFDSPAFDSPELDSLEAQPGQIFGWHRVYLLAALALALFTFFIPTLLSQSDVGPNLLSDAGSLVLDPIVEEQPRWRGGTPMLEPRSRMAVAQLGDLVYAIGGETANGRTVQTTAVYDLSSNVWTLGEALPVPLANATAATLHGRIYVAGGSANTQEADGIERDSGTISNKIFVYTPDDSDMTQGNWTEFDRPLPYEEGIVGASLLAIDDSLYLIGGWDGKTMRSEIWSMSVPKTADAQLDDWSLPTRMDVPRAFLGAAELNGELYIVGGFDGNRELNLASIYHIDEKKWESLPPLLKPRGGLQLVSNERGIYALGGGWIKPVNDHERFDPNTRLWSNFKSPLQDRWRHLGAIIHNDNIYVFGGWSGNYLKTHQLYDISLSRLMLPFMSEPSSK